RPGGGCTGGGAVERAPGRGYRPGPSTPRRNPAMNRRITMIALPALLLLAAVAHAAPAPVPNREALEALEALKKQLPDVLPGWGKGCLAAGQQAEVRLARRVAPEEAKAVIALGSPKEKMGRAAVWAGGQGGAFP